MCTDRYDRHNFISGNEKRERMAGHDPGDVERRVRAGEWVPTTAVAALFGKDRTTVYRWTRRKPPLIHTRRSPGGGGLECDPKDVLRELDKYRKGSRTAPAHGDGGHAGNGPGPVDQGELAEPPSTGDPAEPDQG